jgi:hypothetical protein
VVLDVLLMRSNRRTGATKGRMGRGAMPSQRKQERTEQSGFCNKGRGVWVGEKGLAGRVKRARTGNKRDKRTGNQQWGEGEGDIDRVEGEQVLPSLVIVDVS